MVNQIPIPYKVFLRKFWIASNYGQLTMKEARLILSRTFRMDIHNDGTSRANCSKILKEMDENGFINLKACKYVELITPLEECC